MQKQLKAAGLIKQWRYNFSIVEIKNGDIECFSFLNEVPFASHLNFIRLHDDEFKIPLRITINSFISYDNFTMTGAE
jgi:hypothetical protein